MYRRRKLSIIKVDLKDMLVAVTGSGPYDVGELISLFAELGAVVVEPKPGQALNYIIVGHRDYDTYLLKNAQASLGSDRILSQEEIIGLVFLDRHPDADCERRRRAHEGLAVALDPTNRIDRKVQLFVSSVEDRYKELYTLAGTLATRDRETIQYIFKSKLADLQSLEQQARNLQSKGFLLPADSISLLSAMRQAFVIATETLAETEKQDFFSEWPEQSELRSKYHYTVKSSTTAYHRHKALRNAVQGMGLYPVVNHIAAFASLHADTPRMKAAVTKWREDLEWLKTNYYQDQFRWPGDW